MATSWCGGAATMTPGPPRSSGHPRRWGGMSSGPPTSIAMRVRKRPGLLELDRDPGSRGRRAAGPGTRPRRTGRGRWPSGSAPPTSVFARRRAWLPRRPLCEADRYRADSPSVVTTEEFCGFFDVFEPFVFDAMSSSIPTPPRGQSRPRESEPRAACIAQGTAVVVLERAWRPIEYFATRSPSPALRADPRSAAPSLLGEVTQACLSVLFPDPSVYAQGALMALERSMCVHRHGSSITTPA